MHKKDANDQKNTDGSSQSDIWQSKSAKVYVKFEEFLKDRSKDEVEVLFKVPSEQERQNNANHVEIKDDNLIKKPKTYLNHIVLVVSSGQLLKTKEAYQIRLMG